MSLIDLLLSDLKMYYVYTGRPEKNPKKRELYKCFLIPRCLLATLYRISYSLHKSNFTKLGQVFTWTAFLIFGSEINCKTKIGSHLFFPHPNGIVIGAKSIGSHAVIYHQTTIGAARVEFKMNKRPQLGDNIVIGAGAKIIGDFFVPNNSLIKANSLVTIDNLSSLQKTERS